MEWEVCDAEGQRREGGARPELTLRVGAFVPPAWRVSDRGLMKTYGDYVRTVAVSDN